MKRFLLLGLALFPAAACCQGAHPRLTRDQAIAQAAAFCQKLGAPVSGAPGVEFPSTGVRCWQPCWRVTFPAPGDGVDVDVVDATGTVCRLSDPRPSMRLGNRPARPGISEKEAIGLATAALAATGETDGLALDSATEMQGHSQALAPGRPLVPLADGHEWLLTWRRLYMGVPYGRDQTTAVGINAETGEVTGLSLNCVTPPPASMVAAVVPDAAGATAIACVAAAGMADAVPLTEEAEIDRPNTFWQPGGSTQPLPGLPRLAWHCRFQAGAEICVVNVDAATGSVIGGEVSGPRGGHPPARPALRESLRSAREARVYRRTPKGTWPARPSGTLGETADTGVLSALRAAAKRKASPPAVFGEYRVVLVGSDGRTLADLSYVAREARLGVGSDWIVAPGAFVRWAAALPQETGKPARSAGASPSARTW